MHFSLTQLFVVVWFGKRLSPPQELCFPPYGEDDEVLLWSVFGAGGSIFLPFVCILLRIISTTPCYMVFIHNLLWLNIVLIHRVDWNSSVESLYPVSPRHLDWLFVFGQTTLFFFGSGFGVTVMVQSPYGQCTFNLVLNWVDENALMDCSIEEIHAGVDRGLEGGDKQNLLH